MSLIRFILVFILVVSVVQLSADKTGEVDFAESIRPIFNRHCISCHGGVKQAGGISFVYRDQLINPAKSGKTAIVPGDPQASELIRRITTHDETDRMPPVEEDPEGLSSDEISVLRRWIEQGAVWRRHWAFIKPETVSIPKVWNSDWSRNNVDRFVLKRLEQKNLKPAPPASPERWLRRVSLGLIGLPPSLRELNRFLKNHEKIGEVAYETEVNRLLMDKRFGERWASVWLDQVRYADSRGLGQDGKRNIWKYRDWVIDAFNKDLPWDQFTVKQIAGDLLPNSSIENLLATAVHRLTQSSEEGGTDDEEFRVNALVDRVATIWQSWQGLTFGCVQCHNHPYDPIRHEEFYQFAAFFNNTADCDLDEEWPILQVPLDPQDYDQANRLDTRINSLRKTIWETEFGIAGDSEVWDPLKNLSVQTSNDTKAVVQSKETHDEFHTVDTVSRDTALTLTADLPDTITELSAFRITGMPLDLEKARSDSEWGFVLSHVGASLRSPDSDPVALSLVNVIADEPNPFHDPLDSLNEKSRNGFGAYTRIHYPRSAAFILEESLKVPSGSQLEVRMKHRIFTLGAFPLVTKRGYLSASDDEALTHLLKDVGLNDMKSRLDALTQQRSKLQSTPIPVLDERHPAFQRPTHVFIRGLFLTKDKEVQMDIPSLFKTDSFENRSMDRLVLAEWMVSPENPLTARVAVNRFWARLFESGLVSTEEDFGSSGEIPSHPQLLDYLALRFQNELQWSVKNLLREIVLSSTYRQSGVHRHDLSESDPQNRLLARGPRFRLSAEVIRDQALALSGLLSDRMHGPPVHPPIPEGVWKPFQGSDKWRTPEVGNPNRYRRSIYTYIKRSIPYPMFAAFDAPSREFCTPRRFRSNTPLQALMTLNDDSFIECAEALGKRMHEEAEGDLDDKLRFGFRVVVSRDPSEEELSELRNLHQSSAGISSSGDSEDDSFRQEKAFAMVGTVLLNLDELFMN